jgi:hypothetical protein
MRDAAAAGRYASAAAPGTGAKRGKEAAMHDISLYSRGPYRVLDLREDDRPRPWVVVDAAGSWLHEDISFEAARDWVDRREAQRPAAPVHAVSRPRGLR